jgi:hypothetical protein
MAQLQPHGQGIALRLAGGALRLVDLVRRAEQRLDMVPGDVEEGMTAARAIGDDTLQREAGGAVVPDSFTPSALLAARCAWLTLSDVPSSVWIWWPNSCATT